MYRTRRTAKVKPIIEDSSESEDDVPIKKLRPTPKKKVERKGKSANHSSSSESDIENYLQPIDKLDLSSPFFNTEKKSDGEFNNIEKDIFAGVTRLSESSDSELDDTIEPTKAASKDAEEPSSQAAEEPSINITTNVKFQELKDYNKKIEEAKKEVEKYNAKRTDENSLDIGHLLAAGETKQMTLENIKLDDLHSSDFESTDNEWEEVKVEGQTETKEKGVVPKDGLQITVGAMPDHCKKKKGVDLLAAMKRRLNRIRKENQVYVHKVHLLCWIAHGNYVNFILNDMELLGLGLSLLPSDKCYPSDRTDLGYLEQIVQWYKKTITLIEKKTPKELELVNLIKFQINKRQVYDKKMYVLIFIIILRALGIQCRLVMSLQVEPLRPPANELHSLSKETDEKKLVMKEKSTNKKSGVQNIKMEETLKRKTVRRDISKLQDQKMSGTSKVLNKKGDTKIRKAEKLIESKQCHSNKKSEKQSRKSTVTKTAQSTILYESEKNIEKSRQKSSSKKFEVQNKEKITKHSKHVESTRLSRSSKIVSNEPKNKLEEKKVLKISSTETKKSTLTETTQSTSSSKPRKNIDESRKKISSKKSEVQNNENITKSILKDIESTRSTRSSTIVSDEPTNKRGEKPVLKISLTAIDEKKHRSKSNSDVTSKKNDKKVRSLSGSDAGNPKRATQKRKIAKNDELSQLDGTNDSSDDLFTVTDIPQLDGANDENMKKRTSQKPNLQKLRVAEKRVSNRLKVKTGESESENEFSPSPPKQLKKNAPNLSKLKSPVSSFPMKQLDVKNDIINLIKGRIAEQKHIDQGKLARKPINKKTPVEDSDSDSDYMPEPIKKKHHDSDSDMEYFIPKPKVKKRINLKKDGTKIISSDSDAGASGKKKKKGFNYWIEVFLESEEKWISADIIRGQVHCINEIYSRATHPVSYVLAWNNDNTLKDVTRRYCKNFNTITRKLRVEETWWEESLKPFRGKTTARDREEDDDLNRQQLDQPLPVSISEYKNHPLYALRRHLLKFEVFYPDDIAPIGFVKKEAVYPRNCVYICKSREIWLKDARVVKPGEKPYKIVKARPKYDRLSNKMITDQLLEIFGPWQTTEYEPPTAENGIVPRNAFGNVELFKPCMLPKKTVLLKLDGLNKVCKKLNIDCASAIVGFDYHSGFCHPTYGGFVVCEEFADTVVAAWELEQDEIERKEKDKMEKRVYGNWRKLIKGLYIRERLKAKYDFGGESSSTIKEKKKPTRKLSGSESD